MRAGVEGVMDKIEIIDRTIDAESMARIHCLRREQLFNIFIPSIDYDDRHYSHYDSATIDIAYESEGNIIGTVRFHFSSMVVYLEALVVDRPYRRQGVGTALVRTVEDMARERNISAVRVRSTSAARSFYERLGYKRVVDEPGGIDPSAVCLEREIAEASLT